MGEATGLASASAQAIDDLGLRVIVPPVIRRVVSLVPSLTETVASCAPGLLVGATNWCTHPADLAVTRIGGTKNPDVGQTVALRPDVVLANEEENRQPDLDALRAAGLAVWVTRIRDLPEALASLRRMITLACRQPGPAWLDAAASAWQQPLAGGEHGRRSADLASAVDGARQRHLRRRPAGQARRHQRVRRPPGPVPARGHRRTAGSAAPTWSCCRTSRTASPPRTGQRHSPAAGPRWSAAAI